MAFSAAQSFFTFLALGFAGSMHCIGMCGPLSACANTGRSKFAIDTGILNYFVARLLAYTSLGFFAGFLGKVLFIKQLQLNTLWLWWIFIAVMMLFALREIVQGYQLRFARTNKTLHDEPPRITKAPPPARIGTLRRLSLNVQRVSHTLTGWLISKSGLPRGLALGLATALLPCGFLAMALLQAAALASPFASAAGLSGFAIGTSPALWGGAALITVLRRKFPTSARLFVGVIMLLGATMLLMRTNKIIPPSLLEAPPLEEGLRNKKLPCH